MTEPIKYITKVEIQGLWGRYGIEWNLHPDVNLLSGINGSGKSTIINCIYELFFYNLILTDYRNMTETIKLTFDNERYILFNGTISLSTDADKFQLTNMDFVNTFDTELKSLDAVQKLSDERIKTELDWEIDQLERRYANYLIDVSRKKDKIIENSDNPKEELLQLKQHHDKFVEIVNYFFSETGKKINREKNQLEFLLGDKEINAYQLSSGEKQLLVILLTILVQDNKPAILLMDEPEISLHLDWQENLINYIRELNPNVQLIIATHSPGLIMKGWGNKVFELSDLTVKDRLAF